jgi:hypothetical protein
MQPLAGKLLIVLTLLLSDGKMETMHREYADATCTTIILRLAGQFVKAKASGRVTDWEVTCIPLDGSLTSAFPASAYREPGQF